MRLECLRPGPPCLLHHLAQERRNLLTGAPNPGNPRDFPRPHSYSAAELSPHYTVPSQRHHRHPSPGPSGTCHLQPTGLHPSHMALCHHSPALTLLAPALWSQLGAALPCTARSAFSTHPSPAQPPYLKTLPSSFSEPLVVWASRCISARSCVSTDDSPLWKLPACQPGLLAQTPTLRPLCTFSNRRGEHHPSLRSRRILLPPLILEPILPNSHFRISHPQPSCRSCLSIPYHLQPSPPHCVFLTQCGYVGEAPLLSSSAPQDVSLCSHFIPLPLKVGNGNVFCPSKDKLPTACSPFPPPPEHALYKVSYLSGIFSTSSSRRGT